MRKLIIILAIAFAAYNTPGCKNMGDDYTVQTLEGPYPVNKRVAQSGYKIIGEWKLWNPMPLPVSDSDIVFIKTKIPEWFADKPCRPDQPAITALQNMSADEMRKQLQYNFTFFSPGLTETDAYLFQVKCDNKPVNVYIPITDSGVIYPFKDEEWNRQLSRND